MFLFGAKTHIDKTKNTYKEYETMKAETSNILLPRTVLNTHADKDIEFEASLADYLPDIKCVIRVNADVICEELTVRESKAELQGKAQFTLIYESDTAGKVRSEHFSEAFTHKFELGELPTGELFPELSARCSYVGCKTLNPRRFLLKCRADLGLCLRCMQSHGTVSLTDCKDAFFKTEKQSVARYSDRVRRDYDMTENLSLESMPPIAEIIDCSLRFLPVQSSVSDGTVLVRCDAVCKLLYEDETEGKLLSAEKHFPAVFTVDDSDIVSDGLISVSVNPVKAEIQKQMDAYGEYRIAELDYSARVSVSCTAFEDIEYPTDMFFEHYVNECKTAVLPYEIPQKSITQRMTEEKVYGDGERFPTEIIDTAADISALDCVFNSEGITVSGSVAVNVFGKRDGVYTAKDCILPFSKQFVLNCKEESCTASATATLVSLSVRTDAAGNTALRAEAEICLETTQKAALTVLASAEIEKRDAEAEAAKPIIICYPQKSESLWDIAKRYYVNPQRLLEENAEVFDKDGNVTDEGKLIFI